MIPQIGFLNFYILPLVCFIGLFIELISALTFYKINSRLRTHDKHIKIYHYLFLYSISNIVVLLINLLYGVLNCGAYCLIETYVNIYYIKQFERFGKIFICNTFNTFNIFIEFLIALDRYEKLESFKKLNNRSLSVVSLGKRANRKNVYLKSLIFLTVSIVINTPYIFIFKLENVSETIVELKPDLKTISQHPMWLKSIAIAYFLKDSSCLLFIVVLNLVISVYLKDGISSLKLGKSSMISESLESHETETRILVNPTRRVYRPKERKVFYMILLLGILLLAGNLPEAIYRVKRTLNILFFTRRNYLPHYLLVSNILSFVCSYFKLFVYLLFSKTFLKQFERSFASFSTRNRNSIYV